MNAKIYKIVIAGLCVLLFIALVCVIYVVVQNQKLSGQSSYRNKLIDPAQALYNKKDLIVNVTPLRERLEALGREYPNLTIYFEALNTGANISIHNMAAFWPASLMKIPVAMAVMKRVEEGTWKLTDELLLLKEDKNNEFGTLYAQPAGKAFTIQYLLDEMLINSDNSARSIFMRNLELSEISVVLEHLGIEDIFNTENHVRAKKYSIFWRSLYGASFLNAAHSEQLLEMMSRSAARQYLQAGIPAGVLFSHKIGVAEGAYSDSGIVYVPGRPYILTVMMAAKDEEFAKVLMRDISEYVYNYVADY